MNSRPLSIPVILGTTRQGRMSAHAAHFMLGQIEKRDGIRTELIDVSKLSMPVDDAGEAIKDPLFRKDDDGGCAGDRDPGIQSQLSRPPQAHLG